MHLFSRYILPSGGFCPMLEQEGGWEGQKSVVHSGSQVSDQAEIRVEPIQHLPSAEREGFLKFALWGHSLPLPIPAVLKLFPSQAGDLWSMLVSISEVYVIVYGQDLAFPGGLSLLKSSTFPGSPHFNYTSQLGVPSLRLEPTQPTL